MTAPEPVEVEADELAAAEQRMRELAAHWGKAGDLQRFAGREPYWTCARHAAVLLAEFDRLREQNFALNAALHAQCDSFEDPAALRADLARALPVVEAAGVLVAEWPRLASSVVDGLPHEFVASVNALARAVRAAREPRTGEGE